MESIHKGDQRKWQSARLAFERQWDRYPDTPISVSLYLSSLLIVTHEEIKKRFLNRINTQGRIAQVVEPSISIREALGSIPGFSNFCFFIIIVIANCNARGNKYKIGQQNQYTRGISSSSRALDLLFRGTGIDTRILQFLFYYNYIHC